MVKAADGASYFLEVGNSRTFKWVEELFAKATRRLPKWEKVKGLKAVVKCGQEIVSKIEHAIRRGISLSYKLRVLVEDRYQIVGTSEQLAETVNPRKLRRPKTERRMRHLPQVSQPSFRSR